MAIRSDSVDTNSAELAAVRAEMDATADPLKRAELARRARELRGHGDLFKE